MFKFKLVKYTISAISGCHLLLMIAFSVLLWLVVWVWWWSVSQHRQNILCVLFIKGIKEILQKMFKITSQPSNVDGAQCARHMI